LLRRAAAVHFTSEEEARQASALGIDWRAAVIPLGVEAVPPLPAGRFAHLRGSPCLLFLSRLDPKKNLEGLLEAVRLLQPRWPALRLLVVGDGAPGYAADLQLLAQRLGVAGLTQWAGRLEGEAKHEAFAAADVFVLPSHSENFGIAAAEALLSGVPCVLGQGVAIAQPAARAGAAIETGTDASSIAQAIERIIASPAQAARMRENAVRFARAEFSVAAMGLRLQALYEDVLRK
jgi:glycosyltransferase involved in cell wall biosynthesis